SGLLIPHARSRAATPEAKRLEDSMSMGASEKTPGGSLHMKRFPGESPVYRAARDRLLAAEVALRRNLEDVAAMRRMRASESTSWSSRNRRPLWNLFDFTREGRGTDWNPKLDYGS